MSINSLNLATHDVLASSLVLSQINPYLINLLVGAFLLISIVMILIVLIQRPQGGGLGGAFGAGGGGGGGGGGAGQTAFGTKTGDVLTGGTIAIFVLFIVFAVILNFVTRPTQAVPSQPTIASPVSTEAIPVDENAEGALDAIGDAVEEAGAETVPDAVDAVEPAVDDEN
jgi:preprotein translocase subunit SecG